MTDGSHCGS